MKFTNKKPNKEGYYVCKPTYRGVCYSPFTDVDLTVCRIFLKGDIMKIHVPGTLFECALFNPLISEFMFGDRIEYEV